MKLEFTEKEKNELFYQKGAGKAFEYLRVIGLKEYLEEYKKINEDLKECKKTFPKVKEFGNHELHILFIIGARQEKKKLIKFIKRSLELQKKYGY